ncbi:hypothetical protein MPSI1_002204 [Malassezia psittaci]|uniref:COP9 signalosome complex subunit 3 N-terminal helical repeats domain-containing protein n=1 Tax=Malassezia psittaci TaxID=1821823 RepID=A0AAF0JE09_9BASI|nr:hypothetical protein MPSI1_002204 [Malassezia psittaci]
MSSTWNLLEASERAERDTEHAVEHLLPFMGAGVPDEALLGPFVEDGQGADRKVVVLVSKHESNNRTAELRHAKSQQDVRKLEDGLKEIHGTLPPGPLYAWANALSDKGRLISRTYASPFLQNAVETQSQFSGAHSALLYVRDGLTQQYLVQRDWHHANELLERTDLLKSDLNMMPYQAVLCYLYYSGLVYSVQSNYSSANRVWSWCLAFPTDSPSHLQLDSLRKLILIKLLNSSRTSPDAMLRGLNPASRSQFARQAQPYLLFAQSYGRRTDSSLTHNILTKYRAQFEADANWGLIKRCMAKQPEFWLENLVKVYTNLPLMAVAQYLDCTEQQAKYHLQNHGKIQAQFYEAKLTDTTIPLPDGIQYKPVSVENATFVKICPQPSTLSASSALSESTSRSQLANQLVQASLAPEHLAKLWSLHTSTLEPPS